MGFNSGFKGLNLKNSSTESEVCVFKYLPNANLNHAFPCLKFVTAATG